MSVVNVHAPILLDALPFKQLAESRSLELESPPSHGSLEPGSPIYTRTNT